MLLAMRRASSSLRLALLGGAALAFLAFEVMRPHPTEQVPPP